MKTGISSIVVLLFWCASNGFATLVGTDNASAVGYSGGWSNNTDGFISGDEQAFGPWSLSNTIGMSAGFFLGDSTALSGNPGSSGADINSSGVSFRMYAYGLNDFAIARRSFDSSLAVGQTFSVDLAVNDFAKGYKGFNLNANGNETLFKFQIGGNQFVAENATTATTISNAADPNTAFHLSFTQTSAGEGTWSVVRSGGISSSTSGTYTGVPRKIELYSLMTSVGEPSNESTYDLYANNLSVSLAAVPEPAAALCGGLVCGVLGLVAAGRRVLAWFGG